MSLTPGSPPPFSESTLDPAPPVPRKPRQGRVLTLCFAVFAFEVGLFLIILPWRDSWTFNYFRALNPNHRESVGRSLF